MAYPKPGKGESPAEVAAKLVDALPSYEADGLQAQCLYVLTGILGHDPTVDERRAFMAGCSYVDNVADIALRKEDSKRVVHAAVEAAMSVAEGLVADKMAQEAEEGTPDGG